MAVTTTGPMGSNVQTAGDRQTEYTTDSVTSKDGTTIGYRQLGSGPGLVLLHGGMESAQSHMQLAEALASTFTVYLPDRRGRGMSGPFGPDYSIQKEIEDIEALLTTTEAHFLFGVSASAVISLYAALVLPAVHRLAIFEPALIVNNSLPTDFIARMDNELALGETTSALVTGMKGAQMGPPVFNYVPRWLLERLTDKMIRMEERNAKSDSVTMRALAPTLHYDFHMVAEASGSIEELRELRTEVLLLGGSKSPAYLKTALDTLEKMLPNATRIEFPGLGHGASGNSDRGGKPELVARELRLFFV